MTRQLFPSPSQGALICAGGGKEGRLAAVRRAASGRAGRQDPALHSRAWTGGLALLSVASRTSRDPAPGGRGEPAEVGESALLHPQKVSWVELLVLAGSAPRKQGECVSGT